MWRYSRRIVSGRARNESVLGKWLRLWDGRRRPVQHGVALCVLHWAHWLPSIFSRGKQVVSLDATVEGRQ